MRVRNLAVLFILLLVVGACGSNEPASTPSGVSLEILEPSNKVAVKGNTLKLRLQAKGVEIVKADGDSSGKTGHFHIFIDQPPVATGEVIPKAAGIVHSAVNEITLTGLPTGVFGITVVLGDGTHTRLGNVKAELKDVSVAGPSVTATVPASATAGQPFSLDTHIQGVTLGPADGDTSGRTGHLHLFIDRDPTPAGQAIPKGDPAIIHVKSTVDGRAGADLKVEVPALAKGDHVIWVVLGNGIHVPFDPPVLHKITITVS